MLGFFSSRLRQGARSSAFAVGCLLLAPNVQAQDSKPWTSPKRRPSAPEPPSEYSLPGVNSERDWLVLVHGTFAAAFVSDSYGPSGVALKSGGAVIVGGTPIDTRFLMAGRLSGGAYTMSSSGGFVGGAALFGTMLRAPQTVGRAGYVLVGPGVEYLPGASRALVGAHLVAGVVMSGFNIGGGFDALGGEDIGMGLFTFHLGFGSLL